MAHTQILVHRWGPRTRISALFHTKDLTRSLVSCVVQSSLRPSTKSRFKLEIYEILQKKKKNSQRSVVSSDEIVLSHHRVLMERILLTNEVWW